MEGNFELGGWGRGSVVALQGYGIGLQRGREDIVCDNREIKKPFPFGIL